MAKAIWSGSISFGLVNIPIKLYTAVRPTDIKFNQINLKTGSRVRQKRIDEVSGDEVPYSDVVKGYEISPGRYVTVSFDELEALNPEQTRTIEISHFVPLESDMSPLFYEKVYYLAPAEHAERPYQLLMDAMKLTATAALGHFVLRSKAYPVLLRSEGQQSAMSLTTLNYVDEIVDTKELAIKVTEVSHQELTMATNLINALTAKQNLAELMAGDKDTHATKVMELIAAKAKGESLEPVEVVKLRPVTDIMAALEASLAAMAAKKTTDG